MENKKNLHFHFSENNFDNDSPINNEQDKEHFDVNYLDILMKNLEIDDETDNNENKSPITHKLSSDLNIINDKNKSNTENPNVNLEEPPSNPIYSNIMSLSQKNFIMFIKKVNGSIKLQNALDIMNQKEINWILENILSSLPEIMCSLYGNYFFQKFITFLTSEQRQILINKLKPDFKQVCSNKHGTYCIQALYKQIKDEEERKELNELISNNLSFLLNNENGIHIIIDLIIIIPEEKREFINDYLIKNIHIISSTKLGNICLKKLITISKNIRNNIIASLRKNFYEMLKNDLSINLIFFIWNTYGYFSCHFIIEEITKKFPFFINFQNYKIDFVEKSLLLMGKYENQNFNCFSYSLFQNDFVFYSICSSIKGKKVLKTIYNNSSVNIQTLFMSKYTQLKI